LDDLHIIRQRLTRMLAQVPPREQNESPSTPDATWLVTALRQDGSWPDIDYTDRQRSHWAPARHLDRVLALLRAARAGAPDPPPSEKALSAARRALGFWLSHDPKSDNWWHNDIGTPLVMGRILLLFGDDLEPALFAKAVGILARVEIGKTGQNRAWLATIAFMRGLLSEDHALVRRALDEILAEIRVTTEPEGIQPDWSFHQHGPQLYQGNYGAAFMETCAPYATLLSNTRFSMAPEAVETLCRMMLEGTRWMTWGDLMDYHVVGRFISCPHRSRWESRTLITPCEHLAEAAPHHRDELLRFRDRLTGRRPAGSGAPSGNRHYWRSDFMVHRREGFYASIRMSSVRTVRSEACNGEGLRNYHMGDGVTLFLRSGQEYVGIFPTWDWRRLPGVTCRQVQEPLPVLSTGRHRGNTEFAGGVSDGQDGLAALNYNLDGVRARKAWFCRGNGVVCLGAGINSDSDPVTTSVNQCLLRGDVTYANGSGVGTLRVPGAQCGDLRWVHHDGVGYLLLDADGSMLRAGPQSGAWHDINSNLPDDPVTCSVFRLWIDHGYPSEDAKYAYAVVLGVEVGAMNGLADAPGIEVLANSQAVQAVAFDGQDLVQVAFFEAGGLGLPGEVTLEVDTPCLLMLRRQGDVWTGCAADPTQKARRLKVTVAGREVAVAFPSGGRAGSTVCWTVAE